MKSLRFPADRTKPAEATCPSWLRHEAAREEWTRLGPTLTCLGLLDETTVSAFACYCQLVARVEQINDEVDRVGLEAAVTSGLWQAELDAGRELLAYCEALLMTPAARAKASAEGVSVIPARPCAACGELFTPKRKHARRCSGRCRAEASRTRRRPIGESAQRPNVRFLRARTRRRSSACNRAVAGLLVLDSRFYRPVRTAAGPRT